MKKIAIAAAPVVIALAVLFGSRESLLQRGAREGKPSLVGLALTFGADKNGVSSDGSTPLMLAASHGQAEPAAASGTRPLPRTGKRIARPVSP